MTIPYMHIYRKPAVAVSGTAASPVVNDLFLGKYKAFEYRHRVTAMGGFDTASCRLDVSFREASFLMRQRLGNRVAFYVDDPMFPIWEGFINRVTIKRGGLSITRSIDEMVNRAQVVWTRTGATPQTQITAEVSSTASQSIYGSKGGMAEVGNMYLGGDTLPTAQRNKIVAQLAFPQMSTVFEGGSEYEVAIECLGFYHTLNWDVFPITSTTVYDAHEAIQRLMCSSVAGSQAGYNSGRFAGNGRGRFYDTESTRIIIGNTAFTTTIEKRAGETHWNKITQIATAGDGALDWIVGITRTDPNLKVREAYYMPAQTDPFARYSVETGEMRRINGLLLRPYEIGPNQVIVIQDALSGPDPLQVRIETVEYDAESNEVSWQTKDNLTVAGVFGVGRTQKMHGRIFGAQDRVVYI